MCVKSQDFVVDRVLLLHIPCIVIGGSQKRLIYF